MHYSRMQRKARSIPVSSLWFQGYGALAGFNAYVFSEGNGQSGKCLELAAIVNDVKKGTIRFPFALVPEASVGA
ncbi:hypothetical protein ACLB1N_14675 [Escherichia coli]